MKKLLLFLIVLVVLVVAWRSCRKEATPAHVPTPTSSAPKGIPQREAITGATLNKAFPVVSGEFKLTFTQEKDGFAQAELSRRGAKVAALTVSDTDANPSARDKFKTSTRKIGGYPAAAVGSQGTAVLVADRYQVQVRSLNPTFSDVDREAWIGRFRLDALAAIGK